MTKANFKNPEELHKKLCFLGSRKPIDFLDLGSQKADSFCGLEKLFDNIKKSLDSGIDEVNLIREIRPDDEMILASNSYCERCGNCCSEYCKNKEEIDGKTSCSLHSSDYPGNKRIPDYNHATSNKLDNRLWVKPECCFTYGPYLSLIHSLYHKEDKESVERHTKRCKGSSELISDFLKWNI